MAFGQLSVFCFVIAKVFIYYVKACKNDMQTLPDAYKEIITDYRSLDKQLSEFKRLIRLQPDIIQCEIESVIISETPLNDFLEAWIPNDLIVASRKVVRDTLQMKVFDLHKDKCATLPMSLCYRSKDMRRQNIEVDIPGLTESRKQILVLNDIVLVDIGVVEDALNA